MSDSVPDSVPPDPSEHVISGLPANLKFSPAMKEPPPCDAARTINPLGAFSMSVGILASGLAAYLYYLVGQPLVAEGGGGHPLVLLGVGAVLGFYLGIAVATVAVGLIGAVAGLFGLIGRPRWLGFVGLVLNLAVPAVLFFQRFGGR